MLPLQTAELRLIYNFQAMRAFAALIVTFVHVESFVAISGISHDQLKFGYVGVDLFFVLSGFVIVYSTARNTPSAIEFARHRLERVAPLYWLLTLGVFFVALVAPSLLNATSADLTQLFKSMGFIPFRKENGLVQPVLFVGWTLNYEMFFYLVFAVFLWLTRSRPVRTVVLSSAFIVAMVVAVQLLRPNSVILNFFAYPIVVEFVMGMWIAMAALRWPDHVSRLGWPVLIVAGAWLMLHMTVVPENPRWLYAGIPAAAILWACLMLERQGHVASNPTVQLLGAASYALYLSHPFVLQGIARLIAPVNSPMLGPIAALLAIVIAHLVGIGIHLWIEKPMVSFLKNRRRRSRPAVTTRTETLSGEA